eukprot:tig00020830_g14396.t1
MDFKAVLTRAAPSKPAAAATPTWEELQAKFAQRKSAWGESDDEDLWADKAEPTLTHSSSHDEQASASSHSDAGSDVAAKQAAAGVVSCGPAAAPAALSPIQIPAGVPSKHTAVVAAVAGSPASANASPRVRIGTIEIDLDPGMAPLNKTITALRKMHHVNSCPSLSGARGSGAQSGGASPTAASDASGSRGAAAKKKKPTKKKPAAESLVKLPADFVALPAGTDEDAALAGLFEGFPVEARRIDAKRGRGLVATTDLQPGDLVFRSAPYAAVVNDNHLESFCHNCYGAIPLHEWCEGCNAAWYCSADCKEKHAGEHGKWECEALRSLYKQAKDDTSLIRLAIKVLARRRKEIAEGYPKGEQCYEDVLRLLTHRDSISKESITELRASAKTVQGLVPETARLRGGEDIALDLLCRLKCNHHGLDDTNNRRYGIAFYPRACFLNHSCAPNVCYTTESGELVVRAVVPVAKGEELCLSYTDMYQVAAVRQEHLQNTYYFKCECPRCKEEAGGASPDRFLRAFRCPIPRCTGVLEAAEKGEEAATCAALRCGKCGERKEGAEQVRSMEAVARAFLAKGTEQREGGLFPEARATLEQLLALYEKVLHGHHVVLFQAYSGLMNVCNATLDLHAAATYCRKIIHLMENAGCYPRQHPDICAHWAFLGNSYLCIAQSGGTPEQELPELLRQAADAFTRCHAMLRVCRGALHPATRDAFSKLCRVEQTRRMLL